MNPGTLLKFEIPQKRVGFTTALHLSDLHFEGGTFIDEAKKRHLAHLVAAIKESMAITPIDLIFVTGDIIDNRGLSEKVHMELLTRSREWLEKLREDLHVDPNGLVVIAGNHDVKGYGLFKKSWGFNNFQKVFPSFKNHRLFTGDMKLLVGCFDSNGTRGPLELATGVADISQIDELTDSINSIDQIIMPQHRVALVHHHPLPVPASEFLDPRNLVGRTLGREIDGAPEVMLMRNGGVFLQRLLNSGFQLVLHGHLHASNHWGPLKGQLNGQQHSNAWLQVISGRSVVIDNDSRSCFGIVEMRDDGAVAYIEHGVNTQGMREPSRKFQSIDYRRAREQLHLMRGLGAAFSCRCHHKIWEVTLPGGDIVSTEIFHGLRSRDGTPQQEFKFTSHSECLTCQIFEATVLGSGPAVTVARREIRTGSVSLEYCLRFDQPLSGNQEVTLVCQRKTLGGEFSSQDSQKFCGISSKELGRDGCSQKVWFHTEQLMMSLRFRGEQAPPKHVTLEASDQNGKISRAETEYVIASTSYLHADPTYESTPEFLASIHSPLLEYRYSINWQLPNRENIPSLASLNHYRTKLLQLPADPNRKKEADAFLEACLKAIRAQISTIESHAMIEDPNLHACLFCVDASTRREGEHPWDGHSGYRGATLVSVSPSPGTSLLSNAQLKWGRDVVGRAARRGVVVSFDRSAIRQAIEIIYDLPKEIAFLVAYPLYCNDPDGFPSAILAVATTREDSGLRVIVESVATDDEISWPLQAEWLTRYEAILGIPS